MWSMLIQVCNKTKQKLREANRHEALENSKKCLKCSGSFSYEVNFTKHMNKEHI